MVRALFLALCLCGILISCQQESTAIIEPETEIVPEKEIWKTVEHDTLFSIDLPEKMEEYPGLHPEALIEFAQIESVGSTVEELYLIVLADEKKSLKELNQSVVFEIQNFAQLSLDAVVAGYDTYEIFPDSINQRVNEMPCRIYEIDAALGDVETFHVLGVFESGESFYRVLTWTLFSQKDKFKESMWRMILSFERLE